METARAHSGPAFMSTAAPARSPEPLGKKSRDPTGETSGEAQRVCEEGPRQAQPLAVSDKVPGATVRSS